jgi:hypothetical protein
LLKPPNCACAGDAAKIGIAAKNAPIATKSAAIRAIDALRSPVPCVKSPDARKRPIR